MRRRTLLPSLLVATCLCTAAVAEVDVPTLIAGAPPADAFPEADIVVLHHGETITVDDAGRVTRRVHTVRRLQTQWAMRRHADARLAWDSARQDLEVLTARTFMQDGTVVPTPDNGYNEVTPDAVARAVPFLGVRELVVSHVGTEIGCVVDLVYEVRDRDAPPLPASGTVRLGGDHPVLHAEVRVEGAAAELRGDDVPPVASGHWVLRDLPSYHELPRDQRRRAAPRVIWSTLADADELATAMRTLNDPAALPGEGVRAWVASVRRDPEVLTDADVVAAVAELMHDGLRAVHLPGGPWARAPRPVEDVLATAVATPWEQALLGLSALRAAGFAPELGLFGDGALPDGEPLDSDRFDHLRLVVRLGDENWWLGPDRDDAWSGHCDLAGADGAFLAADGGVRVYSVPERPLVCRWTVRIGPDGDAWSAAADLDLGGLGPAHPEPHVLAESLAGRLLEDGELTEIDVRQNVPGRLSCRFSARGAGLGDEAGGLIRWDAPWPAMADLAGALAAIDLDRAVRRHPLRVRDAAQIEMAITLDLPDGWSVDHPLPGERVVQSGPLLLEERGEARDGGLRRTVRLDLASGVVAPADWPAFREAVAASRRIAAGPFVVLTGN